MNEKELLSLIQQGEGIEIEFKEAFPKNISDLGKELVAFTNTQGGTLLIGVNDTGNILGLTQDVDIVIQRVAGIVRDVCRPPINPKIGHLTTNGKSIVWVKVTKEIPPRSSDDKYYIRVGSTVRVASSDELVAICMGGDHIQSEFNKRMNALFKNFQAENLKPENQSNSSGNQGQLKGEEKRISIYQEHDGLFLTHVWQSSRTEGQVADIAIMLFQHGDGPLNRNEIVSVEYYLGPKFSEHPFKKSNRNENFKLYVSAYAPMLCLAKVNFKNDRQPLYLERYCDF